MTATRENPSAEFELSASAADAEFPTGCYIEIGNGSTTSYAGESHGANSGAHNKSVDELRDVFEQHGEAILQAATSDIRTHFQSQPI